MGIKPAWCRPSNKDSYKTNPINPDPFEYKILSIKKITWVNLWVVKINYPNCTNFEGNKILVLSRNPKHMLQIDPHFNENGHVVARFAPTPLGWKQAVIFAETIATWPFKK